MTQYLPPYGSATGTRQTRTAAGAITGGLLVTDDDVLAGADATDWLGVASHDAASGESYGVYSGGLQKLVASAAVAKGPVKCAAGGKVVAFVPGTDDPTRLVAHAQEAADADGDLIICNMVR